MNKLYFRQEFVNVDFRIGSQLCVVIFDRTSTVDSGVNMFWLDIG